MSYHRAGFSSAVVKSAIWSCPISMFPRALPHRLGCEEHVLCDLSTTNGTFLNDERIQRKSLNCGDCIRIGTHIMRFLSSDHIEAHQIAAEIPFEVSGLSVPITISVGVASAGGEQTFNAPESGPPVRSMTPEAIIRAADVALYRAKSQGRNSRCCRDSKRFRGTSAQVSLRPGLLEVLVKTEIQRHLKSLRGIPSCGMFDR